MDVWECVHLTIWHQYILSVSLKFEASYITGQCGAFIKKCFLILSYTFQTFFLLFFIIKFVFLSFSFLFFLINIKFPQQHINQSETWIGGFQGQWNCMLVRFWIGLWYLFLSLLMQYKCTFFLCCKSYVNKFGILLAISWLSCVSVSSIVLLFHAFISNGNLFKNGAVECDEICKHYGMNRIKTIFF